MSRTYAVVTGGGTSGHVLPAIAILDRLAAAGHDRSTLHYVGTTRGIEQRLVPPTGVEMTLLPVVGLQRSFSARNLAVAPRLVQSTWLAVRLLRRLRPRVVVNLGGYASFPATFAARLLRIPVVVVSYDLRPGLVSKIAARFATAVAAAFPESPLPKKRPVGAPLRPEILAVDRSRDRADAREALDLPADRFVLAAFGGSLGAQAINDAVAGLVEHAAERADLAVHHVVGERWQGEVPTARDGSHGIMYHVIGYEDRMPQLYAAADLMVTRGGASTVAELACTGTPAIIVPWPGAAENHQLDNARTLGDVGAAIVLDQAELSAARLLAEVERFLDDRTALDAMAAAAATAGARHRDDSLIRLIEEVAG